MRRFALVLLAAASRAWIMEKPGPPTWELGTLKADGDRRP